MEEDEEIRSHLSAEGTGSPSPSSPSPPSNGRITVTVAAGPPSEPPLKEDPQQHDNNLELELLPPQSQPLQTKNGGGGREDCWSEGATGVLIDAWGERYLELSRGNLKQKHWKEVADIVSARENYTKTPKTDIQCKNRIDTVKKKYKSEKAKIAGRGGPSKWVFFDKLDQLIGPTAKVAVNAAAVGGSGGSIGLLSKVPMGIPVGIRSSLNPYRVSQLQERHHHQQQQQQKPPRMIVLKNKNKMQLRKRGPVETDSEEEDDEEEAADSFDSFPPPPTGKRARRSVPRGVNSVGRTKKLGNPVRELTQAILRFGEAYEQAESAKLQQVVEMEKQRMKFAKELELQRMQFFMKTQLEISQMKHGRRAGNSSNHHGNINNSSNNNNNNNNNSNNNNNNIINSDSSN